MINTPIAEGIRSAMPGAGARIFLFLVNFAPDLLLACSRNLVKSHAAAIQMRASRRVGVTSMP
jgi:hypothetical protein